jgi:hypothetical protein
MVFVFNNFLAMTTNLFASSRFAGIVLNVFPSSGGDLRFDVVPVAVVVGGNVAAVIGGKVLAIMGDVNVLGGSVVHVTCLTSSATDSWGDSLILT